MRALVFQGYLWGYILSKANKTFTINKLKKAGKNIEKLELINKLILKCTKRLVKISGADVTVTRFANVPLDEPVLYVGNHQSNMDNFKSGSLRIAMKSAVKVILVSIKDSYKLTEKRGGNRAVKVSNHYSDAIDSKSFKDTNELTEAVQAQIKNHLL
ncbi:hypothetical protein [Neobacillus drentensis]|uniref:hypothetical protein n=1 Tax=Neobacillus drentensis TaxID=220684 RepID=UPI0008240C80|nr:hypothetical protein [Neobacillus drentensis]